MVHNIQVFGPAEVLTDFGKMKFLKDRPLILSPFEVCLIYLHFIQVLWMYTVQAGPYRNGSPDEKGPFFFSIFFFQPNLCGSVLAR